MNQTNIHTILLIIALGCALMLIFYLVIHEKMSQESKVFFMTCEEFKDYLEFDHWKFNTTRWHLEEVYKERCGVIEND